MNKSTIQKYAEKSLSTTLKTLPTNWIIEKIKIEDEIPLALAYVEFDKNADGGRSAQICISMQGITKENYKKIIASRIRHEIVHCIMFDFKERIFNEVTAMEERMCEIAEGFGAL